MKIHCIQMIFLYLRFVKGFSKAEVKNVEYQQNGFKICIDYLIQFKVHVLTIKALQVMGPDY